MSDTIVFKAHGILDNPRFEGFAFADKRSLRGKEFREDDFRPDDTSSRKWQAPRLTKIWKAAKVIGRVLPFNDFPCINMRIPAFSGRAVDVLRDLLEPNGELLPLLSDVGEYYAYNITTVADVLDQKRSAIERFSKRQITVLDVKRFEFKEELLHGLSIFRLVELPGWTFVTNVFEQRVRKYRLQGFQFNKLWPLPKHVNWRDLEKKQWKAGQKIRPIGGDPKPIKGNTLVIRLGLEGKKPSKREKAAIAAVQDELDRLLVDRTGRLDYFGSLEGLDVGEVEYRLFLSCPDVDALVKKLGSWLKKIEWEGPVRVLKRYGEYVDPNAREEYFEI